MQDLDKLVKDLTQMFIILASAVTTIVAYLTLRFKSHQSSKRQRQQARNHSKNPE